MCEFSTAIFFAFGNVQILSGFHYLNSEGSSAAAMKLRANSNIAACNQNILRIFWINCGGIQFSSNVEYWHSETDWIPEATNSPNIFEKIFVFQGIVKFTSQLLEVLQKMFWHLNGKEFGSEQSAKYLYGFFDAVGDSIANSFLQDLTFFLSLMTVIRCKV